MKARVRIAFTEATGDEQVELIDALCIFLIEHGCEVDDVRKKEPGEEAQLLAQEVRALRCVLHHHDLRSSHEHVALLQPGTVRPYPDLRAHDERRGERVTDHRTSRVLHHLGMLGTDWATANKLMSEAFDKASRVHSMGARGSVPIPGTAKVLTYDAGTDGMDYKWSIEDSALNWCDEGRPAGAHQVPP